MEVITNHLWERAGVKIYLLFFYIYLRYCNCKTYLFKVYNIFVDVVINVIQIKQIIRRNLLWIMK